jgi:glycine/D-amino acid oxidase-like deaminating enzyme
MTDKRPVIAVVGSGVTGLCATYELLKGGDCDVVLIEKVTYDGKARKIGVELRVKNGVSHG